MTDPRPGDRVRATVEATVAVVDKMGVVMYTDASGNSARICIRTGEKWSFEVIGRATPKVGDIITRREVTGYNWADGTVLRMVTPVAHAPIHRAGHQWRFGDRVTWLEAFVSDAEFEVLAVGV